jgi:hypothetical protein
MSSRDAEGAIVSRERAPCIRCLSDAAEVRAEEDTGCRRLVVSRHPESRWLCGCGPWRWCKGVGEIHMDKRRVGEESKGKETDGCPLTVSPYPPTLNLLKNIPRPTP